MVTGSPTAINHFYSALQGSLVIEDHHLQSSEDGSGLHSPTFMDNEQPFDGQSNGCTHCSFRFYCPRMLILTLFPSMLDASFPVVTAPRETSH